MSYRRFESRVRALAGGTQSHGPQRKRKPGALTRYGSDLWHAYLAVLLAGLMLWLTLDAAGAGTAWLQTTLATLVVIPMAGLTAFLAAVIVIGLLARGMS